MILRLSLILAIIAAISGGFFYVRHQAYSEGFNEAQRLAAIQAETSRKNTQAIINTVEKQALEKIASQTAANVEKAIEDARKANPACSPIVPRGVSDALRGHH